MPSTPAQAYGLLLAAIRDPDPVVVLETSRLYRSLRQDVPDDGVALPIGMSFLRREGTDLTLVTWGGMVPEVLAVAEELAADGIEAAVIDVASISPLDMDPILESVGRTGRCVIVHEAARQGGFGAEIAARLADEGFDLARRAGHALDRLRRHLPTRPTRGTLRP